jgi:hypothetical protein
LEISKNVFGSCPFLYMHLQHQLIHVHLVYPSLCSTFVSLSRVSWLWRAHACGVERILTMFPIVEAIAKIQLHI